MGMLSRELRDRSVRMFPSSDRPGTGERYPSWSSKIRRGQVQDVSPGESCDGYRGSTKEGLSFRVLFTARDTEKASISAGSQGGQK